MLRIIAVAATFSVLTLPRPAAAQRPGDSTSFARNALYIEGHPDGTPFVLENYDWISLHYERLVARDIGIGIGASRATHVTCPFFPDPDNPGPCKPTVVRMPLTVSWLSGEKHRFELGGGVLLGHSTGGIYDVGPQGGFLWSVLTRIGYRFQPRDGGLSFRAAYLPQWFGSASDPVEFGVGIGYTF